MTNIDSIVEGCRLHTGEGWASLLERLVKEESLSLKAAYASPVRAFRGTVQIQDRTTSEANIEKWGFAELLQRLNLLPDSDVVGVEEFEAGLFVARCVFVGSNRTLLGCTIVKKRAKALRAPTSWDGSLEALERFNPPEEE